MFLLLVACVFVFSCSLSSASSETETAQSITRARNAIEEFRTCQARGSSGAALYDLLNQAAELSVDAGLYTEAANLLVKLLPLKEKNYGQDSDIWRQSANALAHCYMRLGQYSDASNLLMLMRNKVSADASMSAETLLLACECCLRRGQAEEALQLAEQAKLVLARANETRPEQASVVMVNFQRLGDLFDQSGAIESGDHCYKIAASIQQSLALAAVSSPRNAGHSTSSQSDSAYVRELKRLYAQDRFVQCIRVMSINHDTDMTARHPELLALKGWCYYACGKLQTARELFHKLAQFERSSPNNDEQFRQAIIAEANLDAGLGEFDKGLRLLSSEALGKRALKNALEEIKWLRAISNYCLRNRRPDLAVAYLEKLLNRTECNFSPLSPPSVAAREDLRIALMQSRRYDDIETIYQNLAGACLSNGSGHADEAEALKFFGKALLDLHRYSQAQALLERALKIELDLPTTDRAELVDLAASLLNIYGQGHNIKAIKKLEALLTPLIECSRPSEAVKGELAAVKAGAMQLPALHFVEVLQESYRQAGSRSDVARILQHRLTITEQCCGSNSSESASVLLSIAELSLERGKFKEAGNYAEKALHRCAAVNLSTFAQACKRAKCNSLFEWCRTNTRNVHDPAHLRALAAIDFRAGAVQSARIELGEAASLVPNPDSRMNLLNELIYSANLALCYRAGGHFGSALQCYSNIQKSLAGSLAIPWILNPSRALLPANELGPFFNDSSQDDQHQSLPGVEWVDESELSGTISGNQLHALCELGIADTELTRGELSSAAKHYSRAINALNVDATPMPGALSLAKKRLQLVDNLFDKRMHRKTQRSIGGT